MSTLHAWEKHSQWFVHVIVRHKSQVVPSTFLSLTQLCIHISRRRHSSTYNSFCGELTISARDRPSKILRERNYHETLGGNGRIRSRQKQRHVAFMQQFPPTSNARALAYHHPIICCFETTRCLADSMWK